MKNLSVLLLSLSLFACATSNNPAAPRTPSSEETTGHDIPASSISGIIALDTEAKTVCEPVGQIHEVTNFYGKSHKQQFFNCSTSLPVALQVKFDAANASRQLVTIRTKTVNLLPSPESLVQGAAATAYHKEAVADLTREFTDLANGCMGGQLHFDVTTSGKAEIKSTDYVGKQRCEFVKMASKTKQLVVLAASKARQNAFTESDRAALQTFLTRGNQIQRWVSESLSWGLEAASETVKPAAQ